MAITVFGFPTSPFVRKVLLVAAEKGIEVDLVPATPHKPTPEFLAASPFRMMPAIEDDGFRLADSSAIALYLEARQPDPPLLPTDPQDRGRAIFFDEFADSVLASDARSVAFNRFIGPELLGAPGDAAVAQAAEEKLQARLDWLEGEVPATGWLLGDTYSLADLAVASCLRLASYGMDIGTLPRLAAWYARVGERAAWQAVAAQEQAMIAEAIASGAHRQG